MDRELPGSTLRMKDVPLSTLEAKIAAAIDEVLGGHGTTTVSLDSLRFDRGPVTGGGPLVSMSLVVKRRIDFGTADRDET